MSASQTSLFNVFLAPQGDRDGTQDIRDFQNCRSNCRFRADSSNTGKNPDPFPYSESHAQVELLEVRD